MLVFVRNAGESVIIGDDVTVKILSVSGNKVKIGFEAPKEISVHREEIYIKIQEEKLAPKNLADLTA